MTLFLHQPNISGLKVCPLNKKFGKHWLRCSFVLYKETSKIGVKNYRFH